VSAAVRDDLVRLAGALVGLAATAAALAALAPGSGGVVALAPAPGTVAEALAIFLANATIALAVFAAAGLRLLFARDERAQRALGLGLAAIAGLNAVLIGAQLGELGASVLPRLAPHAALELGGFALAASSYLAVRRGELGPRRLGLRLGACLSLLAAGAAVESFVSGALA
jgi:hypothetical protein